MKANIEKLIPNEYYHIYNRGINGENVFKNSSHYQLFLEKYTTHISPFVETFAYCLLSNHFHVLVKIKSESELSEACSSIYEGKIVSSFEGFLSNQFSHLFNGYAQAINKQFNRTGGLFESPFRRIHVDSNIYFNELIKYIHHNPQKHGFVSDFKDYPYSSYHAYLLESKTKLQRETVLNWFNGKQLYYDFHQNLSLDDSFISRYIIEVD